MKKILLSMAAVAMAFSANATAYTLFDINNDYNWGGDVNGYGTTETFGTVTFEVKSVKSTSTTDLKSPVDNDFSWRIYKSSDVVITSSVDIKTIVITFDDYTSGSNTYYAEMDLSEGWQGTLDGLTYTVTSDGLKNITLKAAKQQVRIKTIIASTDASLEGALTPDKTEAAGGGGEPVNPDEPTDPNVIYSNTFDSNFDGWTKINDETLSDFKGWKINNNNPKCLICNSYYGGEAHAADSWVVREFDFANRTDVNMTFEQAFGYDFPQEQNDNYTVNIRTAGGEWTVLALSNWPEKPAKNWSDWVSNDLDLSEWDGQKVEIGFRYLNDGSKSGAWEIKNLVIKGTPGAGAVEGIEADENVAPVYYNLQGVRVNNPENGLFIQVKGSKATKVLVK